MLFHVTAEHDHMTCPGREGGVGSDEARQFQKWMEGNDEVKVLGQWSHQPSHKSFAIIEASDFAASDGPLTWEYANRENRSFTRQ